jgi:hypothetical protein
MARTVRKCASRSWNVSLPTQRPPPAGRRVWEPPPQFSVTQPIPRQDASRYLQTFQRRPRTGGRNQPGLWIIALIPVFGVSFSLFGLTGLLLALGAFAAVVVGHVALTRRNLDRETIIGGIIGVLGGGLGGLVAVVTILVIQFPSSVLWMSGIVCSSPYHLEHDVSHYSVRPGETFSSVDYACVSGENSYAVDYFVVMGLQALLVAVVLCPVVAIGVPMWRRSRKRP